MGDTVRRWWAWKVSTLSRHDEGAVEVVNASDYDSLSARLKLAEAVCEAAARYADFEGAEEAGVWRGLTKALAAWRKEMK